MKGNAALMQSIEEFHAVWEAMTQFVDNQEECAEIYGLSDAEKTTLRGARAVLARLDAAMAALAENETGVNGERT